MFYMEHSFPASGDGALKYSDPDEDWACFRGGLVWQVRRGSKEVVQRRLPCKVVDMQIQLTFDMQ